MCARRFWTISETPAGPNGFLPSTIRIRARPHGSRAAGERLVPFERETQRLYESPGWTVDACLSESARWGRDPGGTATIVVHGEIFDGPGASPTALARLFLESGPGFAKTLNGSFALVVLDRREDRVLVVTDRLSSRRLFWSRVDGEYLITSDLGAQPRDQRPLDYTGLAWCLGAGAAFHRRTLYEGIRMLDRACVHELTPDGIRSDPYWTYVLPDDVGPEDETDLEEAMAAGIVSAVRRRVSDDPSVFLSLSGGYDSTGVAGVLARDLGIERVEAISYALGQNGAPETDAASAARTAAKLGFPHRVVSSYDGDLIQHLARNARLGEGIANACDEVDGWMRLSTVFGSAPRPALLTGDERLGFPEVTIPTVQHLLGRFSFREVRLPYDLDSTLPGSFVPHLRHGVLADVEQIVARQPPTEDPGDLHMYLMSDQREVHLFLPWRERFAGRFAAVRTPWLDPEMLDLVNRLPRRLRRGKRLYRRVLDRRFPDLLSGSAPLIAGYELNLRKEIRRQAPRLKDWITSSSSRLDEAVPPEFGLRLLEAESRPRDTRGQRLRRLASHGVRRLARAGRRSGPVPLSRPVPGPTLFRRWAILRMALGADPGEEVS